MWVQYSWIWREKKLHVQTYNNFNCKTVSKNKNDRLEIKAHTYEEDGVHFRISLSFIDELEK